MSNAIAHRIADFLKDYEPFNHLNFKDLTEISSTVNVLNLNKGNILFQINDTLHDSFYVVASGVIHLSVISDAEEALIGKCYAGDIFGLRPFFAKNNYQMTAKAREDSIVYAIPIDTFKPFVAQNPDVLDFLLQSFATNSKSSIDNKSKNAISDSYSITESQNDLLYFQSLTYNKKPIIIAAKTLIKEAAQLMTNNLHDNALIIENDQPIGIVTDKDFRSKVATGRVALSQTVDQIMASPVITVAENISVAEAQLVMLKHEVSHLCVTHDGTDKSHVKGIISEHDLIVSQANNPGVLIKEIKRAQNSKDLKQVRDKLTDIILNSIQKNIPLSHINSLSGEITIAMVKRAVELSILDLGSPPARFAFLSIGSQGRKEQLLFTDQDNILVFEDVAPEKYRDIKDYFVKLSKKTTSILEKTGYNLCPYGHNASNINWCKSVSEWEKIYNSWMNTPGENTQDISPIFFDYEMAFGEQKIEDFITEIIFKNPKKNTLFFDYLGNYTIKKPVPLNFFKKFTVEEEGSFKGKFDIKNKGIAPLVDGARLMVLYLGIKGFNSTYLRYKQLAIIDPKFSEIYLNCAEAFLTLSKYRTLEGIKNDSDGQYINLDELSKIDKEKIKASFTAFKDLEEMIKDRIQLTQFS